MNVDKNCDNRFYYPNIEWDLLKCRYPLVTNLEDPPLIFAIKMKDLFLLKLLIQVGAHQEATDNEGLTPLIHAILANFIEGVKFLIENKINLNEEDGQGDTALHYALFYKHREYTELIVENGADVNQINYKSESPLFTAVSVGFTEGVEYLLKQGVIIDQANMEGKTPLHLAALLAYSNILSLLLDYAANPRLIDQEYNTPALIIFLSRIKLKTPTFKKLNHKDNYFTEKIIDQRLVGMRLSLEGAAYSGLGTPLTYYSLAKNIRCYVQEKQPIAKNSLLDFSRSLEEAVDLNLKAEDYLKKVGKGQLVVLEAGTLGHALTIVFYKNQIAKGNCGYQFNSQLKPGLSFYTIQKIDHLKFVISTLLQFSRQPTADLPLIADESVSQQLYDQRLQKQMHFFETELNSVLNLELEHFISLKPQTTGNCGWLAAKMSLLAYSYFSDSTRSNHKEIQRVKSALYYAIKRFDLKKSFEKVEPLPNCSLFNDVTFLIACIREDRLKLMISILHKNPSFTLKKAELIEIAKAKEAKKVLAYLEKLV